MIDKIEPIKLPECPEKDCPCNTGKYEFLNISGFNDELLGK